MNSIFLIINIILLIIKYESIKAISNSIFNSDYIEHIDNLEKLNFNNNIYLPEYQNKFHRINELNDSNFNFSEIRNNRNVFNVPDNIISKIEKLSEIENIAKLINKIEINNENSTKKIGNKKDIYSDDYSFYGNTNSSYYDHDYKYIKKNALIYDKSSSSIKEIISTEPEELKIEYEICKPLNILFKIINKNTDENLIIKDIKTDLYQLRIFPYVNTAKESEIITEKLVPQINSYLEHSIYPRTSFIFQLMFLLDQKTKIKGTLYIEFNDKKVLLIPIEIIGAKNSYLLEPIYHLDYLTKKPYEEIIEIYNPTTKPLVIKEIIQNLDKIKVYAPNGKIIDNNYLLDIQPIIEIEPMSKKKILTLKYYTSTMESDYGFIHLKAGINHLIIPVLLNFINSPIITYPKTINFGLVDITQKSRNNFIRIIPLKLINNGTEFIKIGKVYINYDEIFIQFHQNFGAENIVIKPETEIEFGFFIFNANLEKNGKNFNREKDFEKKIYIETNSTEMPFIKIDYTYLSYTNDELQEISGNMQKSPKIIGDSFSFYVNVKLKRGIKLRQDNSYSPGENITIRDKIMIAKIKNPGSKYQAINPKILIEIDKISEFRSLHYYYIPLLLKNMLYTVIPIQIDNDDLIKIFCGDEDNSISLSICMKNIKQEDEIMTIKNSNNYISKKKIFNIDFGENPKGVKKQKFIFLINPNESPIKLKNIIYQNNSVFFINFEGYEYFGNEDENYYNINYPKKGKILLNKKNNETKNFIIYPNTAIKLSINLITKNLEFNSIKEEIVFLYGENYKFIISLNTTIIVGRLFITDKLYTFEPSFSGLHQSKIIRAKNYFPFELNFLSVTSNDKRIIPKLLTNKLNTTIFTSLLNISLDPSQIFEYNKELEINMNNILTYRELYLWKIEEKYYEKMESFISANVTIKTNILKEELNFNALLMKPNLVKKKKIDFGLKQIGKSNYLKIEVINPCDKVLSIKLILANEHYANVSNNFMFNEKDKFLLDNYNDFLIFECNFIIRVNKTIASNYEYIVIPEKIEPSELRTGIFNKKELLRMFYKYGNEKVKKYLFKSENIICTYDKKKQNEIIINKNNEYNYIISQTFSPEFNEDIEEISNMTKKNIIEDKLQYKFVEKKSLFNTIISYLFKLYMKYVMNIFLYSNINIIESTQSYFIPNNIQNQIYHIPPHTTYKIGPIIFKPNKSGIIRSTLFLKNNLTILYPLVLQGEGGGGIIRFIDYYRGSNNKKCKLYDDKNLVIEIDEYIYENEIKGIDKFNRTLSLMNVGNLPLTIKNITIDNGNNCEGDNIRIIPCKEINIEPKDIFDIDIEISPLYGSVVSNKIIYFNTEYKSFYLNVIVLLSNDFYESKNYIWIYFKCFVIIFIIVTIMLFSLSKIFNLIQRQRREMCDNDEIKEDILGEKEKNYNKEIIYEEKNNNININDNKNKKQNKGKKKKNKKKNNIKEDIEVINNNKDIKNDDKENEDNKIIKKDDNNNKDNDEVKDDNKEKKDEKENNIILEEKKKEKEKEIEEKKEVKENNNSIKDSKDNKKEENHNSAKKKKRRIKNSESSNKKVDNEKEKKENNQNMISGDKKEKEIKKPFEYASNNKYKDYIIYDYNNNNYGYNRNYQNNANKFRKGKRDLNKKYYSTYSNNRKYNNNIYYDNNNNNNIYNNNNTYNNTYNQQQQPKKKITKIIKEKNVKNLKELIESKPKLESKEKKHISNNSKTNSRSSKNKQKENKVEIDTLNNNNNKNIEFNYNEELKNRPNNNEINDLNLLSKNIFDFNNNINNNSINFNNINNNIKKEEMNPIFLNDEKLNSEFNYEQDLIKSFKKYDSKNEDNFIDFNYHFFDKNPISTQQEDEGEYSGNYDDFKFKSLIDNLNNENPFSDEQKSKDENDEFDEFDKNKFGLKYFDMGFDDNDNFEDKK